MTVCTVNNIFQCSHAPSATSMPQRRCLTKKPFVEAVVVYVTDVVDAVSYVVDEAGDANDVSDEAHLLNSSYCC